MKNSTKKLDVKRLVGIAMFAAIAYVVCLVTSPIQILFLSFDLKDSIIAIAGFIYGPVSVIPISLISALLIMPVTGTGIYGFIMNISASLAFSLTAALIYKWRRTFFGAITALYSGSAVTVAVMMLLNLLITPYFMGVGIDMVRNMLPTLLLPFNASKTLTNASIAMFLYKPVSTALIKAKLIKGNSSLKFTRFTAILLAFFAVTLAAAIVLFVVTRAMNP